MFIRKEVGRVSTSIWMDLPPLYFGFILLCNGNRIETDMKMLLENRDHSSFKAAYKDAKAFRYIFLGQKYISSLIELILKCFCGWKKFECFICSYFVGLKLWTASFEGVIFYNMTEIFIKEIVSERKSEKPENPAYVGGGMKELQ